jgi:LPXTG-motif cell wall-anchored protein
MNPRNLLFVVASVIVMGTSAALMSQGLTDGVRVSLPYPVTVGDVVLAPGEYEVRMPSQTNEQILRFFSNEKLRYQTVVQTIPTEGEKTPEESKILLRHIGDQYYFDKIWMEGRNYGFEFPLPDKVRALQRELAVTVPAKAERPVEETNSAALNAQPAESTNIQQPPASLSNDPSNRTAVAVPELKSEVVNPQESVAALQRQQPETRTPAAALDARQDNPPVAEQLPATASNWFAYMLSGVVLLALAGLGFRASAHG